MKSLKFEQGVKETIKKYNLLNKKEKILVACSGGKDSTTALYLLNKFGYDVEAIFIDLQIDKFSKINLENIRKFCKQNKIKLHEISFKKEFGYSLYYILSMLKTKGIKLKPCTICGVLRRYLLNKSVRKLKASKVVTGHNLDDEAQSILMNFFRGNIELNARLGPITGIIKDPRFVPRIKPLYFCLEKDIEKYSKAKNFSVLYKPCPYRVDAFRLEIAKLLENYEIKHAGTKQKIIKSFLKMLPKLKAYYRKKGMPNKCRNCGEPSKAQLCKACQIRNLIK